VVRLQSGRRSSIPVERGLLPQIGRVQVSDVVAVGTMASVDLEELVQVLVLLDLLCTEVIYIIFI